MRSHLTLMRMFAPVLTAWLCVQPANSSPLADRLITSHSVGPVRLGMTIAAARKVLRGFTVKRSRDAEGVALIAVVRGKRPVMNLFAGEADPDRRINEKAVIEDIEVFDSGYATRAGVHPGMMLKEAERHYGKVKEVVLSEIEQREYASFTRAPAGMTFRVSAHSGTAGNYKPEETRKDLPWRSKAYTPHARLLSISINKRR